MSNPSFPSSLDALVVFEVAVSGVPASFDPSVVLNTDLPALLKADTKGFDFSEERMLYDRYAEMKLLREPSLEQRPEDAQAYNVEPQQQQQQQQQQQYTLSSGSSGSSSASYHGFSGDGADTGAGRSSFGAPHTTSTSTATSTTPHSQPPPPSYNAAFPVVSAAVSASASASSVGVGIERVYPSASSSTTPPTNPSASATSASAARGTNSSTGLTERQKIALMRDTVGEADDAVCEFYLESMQWDLEGAIGMYQAMKG